MDHFSPSSLHDKEDLKGRKKAKLDDILENGSQKNTEFAVTVAGFGVLRKLNPLIFLERSHFHKCFLLLVYSRNNYLVSVYFLHLSLAPCIL